MRHEQCKVADRMCGGLSFMHLGRVALWLMTRIFVVDASQTNKNINSTNTCLPRPQRAAHSKWQCLMLLLLLLCMLVALLCDIRNKNLKKKSNKNAVILHVRGRVHKLVALWMNELACARTCCGPPLLSTPRLLL